VAEPGGRTAAQVLRAAAEHVAVRPGSEDAIRVVSGEEPPLPLGGLAQPACERHRVELELLVGLDRVRLKAPPVGSGSEGRAPVGLPRQLDTDGVGDRRRDVDRLNEAIRGRPAVAPRRLHDQRHEHDPGGVRILEPASIDARLEAHAVVRGDHDHRAVVETAAAQPREDLSQHEVGVPRVCEVALAHRRQAPFVRPPYEGRMRVEAGLQRDALLGLEIPRVGHVVPVVLARRRPVPRGVWQL
jgi:hypothetical protein